MALPPRLRKLALTAHVIASVGWLGAVIAFLNLSVTGLTSQDPQTVRGAYLVMERTGWAVLVPLSLASLLTGLISSLGSTWGLFRHYWVLFKLAINLVATIVLLLYTQTLAYLAGVAAETPLPSRVRHGLRDPSPTLHAAAALLLLLVATTLAIYKPRGMTRYGQRTQHRQRHSAYRNPSDSHRPAPQQPVEYPLEVSWSDLEPWRSWPARPPRPPPSCDTAAIPPEDTRCQEASSSATPPSTTP